MCVCVCVYVCEVKGYQYEICVKLESGRGFVFRGN